MITSATELSRTHLMQGQNIAMAWRAFRCPLRTDESDPTDGPRRTGFTRGITLSQPTALSREQKTGRHRKRERERRNKWLWWNKGEKQGLNRHLITSQQELWLHGNALLLSRAGLSCHHLACVLSYGQLLMVCHYGLVRLKTNAIWRGPRCDK